MLDTPEGIALDSSNNIYVANFGISSNTTFVPGSVTFFAAGTFGDVSPNRMISGPNTVNNPSGVALDSTGSNLYVVETNGFVSGPSINIFPSSTNGNVAPSSIIGGDIMFVGTNRQGLWRSFDNGASFSQAPLNLNGASVISLTKTTRLSAPETILLGSRGLYVSTDAGDTFSQLQSLPSSAAVWNIEVDKDPADEHQGDIFVATGQGFYKSTDNGTTFAEGSGIPSGTQVFAVNRAGGNPGSGFRRHRSRRIRQHRQRQYLRVY